MTQNKVPLAKKFHPTDIENWQSIADKKYRGNLTRWMEEVLNKEFERLDKIATKKQLDGKQDNQ